MTDDFQKKVCLYTSLPPGKIGDFETGHIPPFREQKGRGSDYLAFRRGVDPFAVKFRDTELPCFEISPSSRRYNIE